MAEVSHRLGNGVYRLSALRNNQARPVCTGESPGALLLNCTVSVSRSKEESNREPVSKSKATNRTSAKVSRVRASESQQENGTLRCITYLEPESPRFIRFVQTRGNLQDYKTALYISAKLPGRMTPWTRGGVAIHPDTFRSPQQLRAFCTVILILARQGSEKPGCELRLKRLKLYPDTLQASSVSRSYSWRSKGSSKDVPPLYRSRTAYYDILRVSSGATQSQIKTAYYKQSFIYHPDKNPGDKEATQRFSEVSEAYMVLGNISLRKKYDRGVLSQSDVQSAGRPSSKEATSRSTTSPPQQQQQRARRFSQAGGKTMFDFDAFYQAHYGEQLQREQYLRARKQRMQEEQNKNLSRWKEGKMIEMTLAVMLTMGGLILVSLGRP